MEKLLAAFLALTPSAITLDGQPLPTTVDVYQLVESVAQEAEGEEEETRWQGGVKGMGTGAILGCAFGMMVLYLVSDTDDHNFNAHLAACGIPGGIGAGAGLVVGLVAPSE